MKYILNGKLQRDRVNVFARGLKFHSASTKINTAEPGAVATGPVLTLVVSTRVIAATEYSTI